MGLCCYESETWRRKDPGEVLAGAFSEGGVRTITVNRYERDPRVSEACLKKYGAVCQICELDPVSVYGNEIGSRVIHVHHIKPMSLQTRKARRIDPIKDLVPLCPNCHTAIHKVNPLPTPRDFKKVFRG